VGTREKLFHKHGRHLVLVGGLTDAFFFAPYWELLDSRLGERGWCAPNASQVWNKKHQCISQLRPLLGLCSVELRAMCPHSAIRQ